MKSNLAIGFRQLAKITTAWQQSDVATALKLSPATAKQYLQGEGRDEQIARDFFQQLNERRADDMLSGLDKEQQDVEKQQQYLEKLKRQIQLQRELTITLKEMLNLLLTGVPNGLAGRKICKAYFVSLHEKITDPVVRKEMNEYLFQLFGPDK